MPGDASPDLPCAAADDDASPDLHCEATTTLPILVLPPTDIQVIECEQSEAEHGFYDALYKKSLPGSGKKFSS
nr:DNA repair protein RAD5B [Ipomoea trifida]GLL29726.1 DNA repair protein RAD5B [Ipomoea trifida]GLL31478.1 DNA repair protein RAD5B [Ipomoea trifida]